MLQNKKGFVKGLVCGRTNALLKGFSQIVSFNSCVCSATICCMSERRDPIPTWIIVENCAQHYPEESVILLKSISRVASPLNHFRIKGRLTIIGSTGGYFNSIASNVSQQNSVGPTFAIEIIINVF
jgi:hypothetical protein